MDKNNSSKIYHYCNESVNESQNKGIMWTSNSIQKPNIPTNKKFIIELTKENYKSIDINCKRICKVIKFSSEFTIEDILLWIDYADITEYPNFFIFIINLTIERGKYHLRDYSDDIYELQETIFKFSKSHSILIHLTSEHADLNKNYYKDVNSVQFVEIYNIKYEIHLLESFQAFLQYFIDITDTQEVFEKKIINQLKDVKIHSGIIKFLRILELSEDFFKKLVLKVASNGSKNDFLTAIGSLFGVSDNTLSEYSTKYLTDCLNVNEEIESQSTKNINCVNEDSEKEILNEQNSDKLSISSNNQLDSSVLYVAVQSKNQEIIEYVISHWTHLIQYLPFDHQIRITEAAFTTNQLDILCDLLKLSDFPFPKIKKSDNQRLTQIAEERVKLHVAIETENVEEISTFMNNNPYIKIGYNLLNESALQQAVNSKKYKIYYHLKSFGFEATEFDYIDAVLSKDELKKAQKDLVNQRHSNVNKSLNDTQNSVFLLYTKSSIHNRKISKEQEKEYRLKIRKWFEELFKIKFGPELLDVVSQCPHLKIVFDFESFSVENVALLGSGGTLGSMFPFRKWIFIGAKSSSKERDQEIKGVLAHELCHYALNLTYENNCFPYFKYDNDKKKKFEEIIKAVDKWSFKNAVKPDDECNEIISSVFECYKAADFQPELIVRVMQILAQYDDDNEKLKSLKIIYEILFSFYEKFVVPVMRLFSIENKERVKNFNRLFGLKDAISKQKYEISKTDDIEALLNRKSVILKANIPKLLLFSIYLSLHNHYETPVDAKYIFINSEKLLNREIFKELEKILKNDKDLKIIIELSDDKCENLEILIKNYSNSFYLIVKDNQSENISYNNKLNLPFVELKFGFEELSEKSKINILKTRINFQNNSNFTLFDILRRSTFETHDQMLIELSHIVDPETLNLILEESEIIINSISDSDLAEKHIRKLFRKRNLISKTKFIDLNSDFAEKEIEAVYESFDDYKNYFLISDIAGTGKSWAMKNLCDIFREQCSTNWITYVDLKLFIKEFKKQKKNLEFLEFVVQNILKLKTKFEEKLFKKMYMAGKVIFLFDGFDEIAPDCADFVSVLIQSFKSYRGNQMWVATRDYFEVDLKEKLELKFVYKLDEFTEKDGINLIVTNWVLNDLGDDFVKSCKINFEDHIQSSPNYESYKKLANELIDKVTMAETKTIGMPQLYKMIADIFKGEEKESALDLTEYSIFEKFVEILYKRWSMTKGEIREEANVKSQQHDLNFWRFHEYTAMQSLFPDKKDFCGLKFRKNEWPDEEIIACGLLIKRGEFFIFPHETFREFFAAVFIIRILTTNEDNEEILEYFVEFLTVLKFGVVRMFLNGAIDEGKNLQKVIAKLKKFHKKFFEMDSFVDIFTKNLYHVGLFVISVLENENYSKIRKILNSSAEIFYKTKDFETLSIFRKFVFKMMKVKDLTTLIAKNNILQKIVQSFEETKILELIITEAKEQNKLKSFQEALMADININDGNIYSWFGTPLNFNFQKLYNYIILFDTILSPITCFDIIENCRNGGKNILQLCIYENNEELLKSFWKNLLKFYNSKTSLNRFKSLILQKSIENQNLLQISTNCKNVKLHKCLWNLLLKTIDNKKIILTLLTQKDTITDDYLHCLLRNSNVGIIEFAVNKIIEILSPDDLRKIAYSLNKGKHNLLQSALLNFKDLKLHKILWKFVQNSLKNDEDFVKFISKLDSLGKNLSFYLFPSSTLEIFVFSICELEKISTFFEIRMFLVNIIENFKQLVFLNQKFEAMWTILIKYFDKSEIFVSIENCFINYIHANKTVDDFFKIKRKEIYSIIFEEQKDNLKVTSFLNSCLEDENHILELCVKKEDPVLLTTIWKTIDNFLEFEQQSEFLKNIITTEFFYEKILCYSANISNADFQKVLWELIIGTVLDHQDLKKIIFKKYYLRETYFSLLLENENHLVIKTVFDILETFLKKSELKEIMLHENDNGLNLLQIEMYDLKKINKFRNLWEIFKIYCTSVDETKEFFKEKDLNGSNIIQKLIIYSPVEIFQFMMNEMENVLNFKEIREMLSAVDINHCNLLQLEACNFKSIEFIHELHNYIKKYLKPTECLRLIKHKDERGFDAFQICRNFNNFETSMEIIIFAINMTENDDNMKKDIFKLYKEYFRTNNILHYCVRKGNTDELKTLWRNLESVFQYNNALKKFEDIIKDDNEFSVNILSIAANFYDADFHTTLWELLFMSLKNFKTPMIKIRTDFKLENYFNILFEHKYLSIVKNVLILFKSSLNNIQFEEILNFDNSKNKRHIQIFLELLKNDEVNQDNRISDPKSCKSNNNLLNLLGHADILGNNFFHNAVYISSVELFQSVFEELEKVTTIEDIKQLFLLSLNKNGENLLQTNATNSNKSNINEYLSTIMCKYLDSKDLLNILLNKNNCEKNLLSVDDFLKFFNECKSIFLKISNHFEHNSEEVVRQVLRYTEINESIILLIVIRTMNLDFLQFKSSLNESKNLQLLVAELLNKNETILHLAVKSNDVVFHKNLIELLFLIYEDHNKLVQFMSKRNFYEESYLNYLIECNKFHVIKAVFKVLTKKITAFYLKIILEQKNAFGKNLTEVALKLPDNLIHSFLIKHLNSVETQLFKI